MQRSAACGWGEALQVGLGVVWKREEFTWGTAQTWAVGIGMCEGNILLKSLAQVLTHWRHPINAIDVVDGTQAIYGVADGG